MPSNRLVPFLLIVVLALALQFSGWYYLREQRPAFVQIRDVTVLTQITDLCPGDGIQFTVDVYTSRPVLILRANQVWEVGAPRGVRGAEISYSILTEPGLYASEPLDWIVPDLPAGHYERRAAWALPGLAATPATYQIRFFVIDECDRGGK